MKKRLLALALASLTLTGCAMMSEKECLNADWYALGLQDGTDGKNLGYFSQRLQACSEHKVAANKSQYLKGHAQGLVSFCNYETGLQQGEYGHTYEGVCQGSAKDEFMRGYQLGMKTYQLTQTYQSYQNQLVQIDEEIAEHKEEVERLRQELKQLNKSVTHFNHSDTKMTYDEFRKIERTRLETERQMQKDMLSYKQAISELMQQRDEVLELIDGSKNDLLRHQNSYR